MTALNSLLSEPGFIALCVGGVILLLKARSWYADTTKRVLEAHYDLKRATALLQDTLERLAVDANRRHPSTS